MRGEDGGVGGVDHGGEAVAVQGSGQLVGLAESGAGDEPGGAASIEEVEEPGQLRGVEPRHVSLAVAGEHTLDHEEIERGEIDRLAEGGAGSQRLIMAAEVAGVEEAMLPVVDQQRGGAQDVAGGQRLQAQVVAVGGGYQIGQRRGGEPRGQRADALRQRLGAGVADGLVAR